eukprot:m.146472 g.146472  ORF g.146472 m.146472 type:complete len:537 (-) comp30480_c0_seq4:244-1854(-)
MVNCIWRCEFVVSVWFAITLVFVSHVKSTTPPNPTSITYFTQTVDHFRFNTNATFKQKVLVYDEFHDPGGPLLVYFGNEGQIEDFYNNTGAMFELAPQVRGRIVFLEHRYYGSSLPFGANSYDNEQLQLLTIEQALADMAMFLSEKNSFLGCPESVPPNTTSCPVVLFGGSYGGMLAAWFMLKYPHMAVGALAASAPVDIYPGEDKAQKFFDAGMFVYGKYGSAGCEAWIRSALATISSLGNTSAGRFLLSSNLHTCNPITTQLHVERVMLYINGALSTMAMVDYPFPSNFVTPMPANPVGFACNATHGLSPASTAAELMKGLNTVINVFVNYTGQLHCHNASAELLADASQRTRRHDVASNAASRLSPSLPPLPLFRRLLKDPHVGGHSLGDINRPWNFQACSELILEPLTSDGDGFFVEEDSAIPQVEAACRAEFDVIPRPGWMVKAYGTGEQLVKATHNIIFSDGEKDPWRIGGVPANAADLGDGSVVHILIEDGAHHQDLRFHNDADPPTVTAAKAFEFKTIAAWLAQAQHK